MALTLKHNIFSKPQLLVTSYIDKLSSTLFFNQPYLDPDNPGCTANEFFKEISYMIDLSCKISTLILVSNFTYIEIYKIMGTCYYHDEMKYCPIQLQIVPEKVKKGYNDCEYLVQVWDMNKQKIF